MKVYSVESTNGEDAHWVVANTPEEAIDCVIEEELEELEDKANISAKELAEEELDKVFINIRKDDLELTEDEELEDLESLDFSDEAKHEAYMNKYYDRIPMKQALADAEKEGKAEVVASTIFLE